MYSVRVEFVYEQCSTPDRRVLHMYSTGNLAFHRLSAICMVFSTFSNLCWPTATNQQDRIFKHCYVSSVSLAQYVQVKWMPTSPFFFPVFGGGGVVMLTITKAYVPFVYLGSGGALSAVGRKLTRGI